MNLIEYRRACNAYINENALIVSSDDCAALQEIYERAASQKITNSMSTDHVKLIAQAYFEGRKKESEIQKKIHGLTPGQRVIGLASVQR